MRSVAARIRWSRPQIPNCRSSVKERRSHVAWSSVEQELELERLSLEEIGGSMLPDTTRFSSKCTVTIGSCRDEVTSLLSHRGIENKASLQQPSTVAYVVRYCCTNSPQPLAYRECFIVLKLSTECVQKKKSTSLTCAHVQPLSRRLGTWKVNRRAQHPLLDSPNGIYQVSNELQDCADCC